MHMANGIAIGKWAAQVKKLAEFLLACKQVGTPTDALLVVSGLKTLTGAPSTLPIPLFTYTTATTLPASGKVRHRPYPPWNARRSFA